MTIGEADHEPQPGLSLLVVRVLGIAALVIGASAALFLGLGRLGDPPLEIAAGPDDGQPADEDDQAVEDEPAAQGDDAPAEDDEGSEQGATDPEDAAAGGSETAAPEDGADGDPDSAEPDEEGPDAASDDGSDEADETEEPEEPEEPAPDRIDPSTVSVQVLDGYQEDGGTAAGAVATQLADEGYDIIARNPALLYDVTTVLWTSGHEQAGRQIAEEIGAAEVREQPGNLSTAVMVHVVVGADRG